MIFETFRDISEFLIIYSEFFRKTTDDILRNPGWGVFLER